MWVGTKEAAAILQVNYESFSKKIQRLRKRNEFFCQVGSNLLVFIELDGIGRSGRVYQLDVPDELVLAYRAKKAREELEGLQEASLKQGLAKKASLPTKEAGTQNAQGKNAREEGEKQCVQRQGKEEARGASQEGGQEMHEERAKKAKEEQGAPLTQSKLASEAVLQPASTSISCKAGADNKFLNLLWGDFVAISWSAGACKNNNKEIQNENRDTTTDMGNDGRVRGALPSRGVRGDASVQVPRALAQAQGLILCEEAECEECLGGEYWQRSGKRQDSEALYSPTQKGAGSVEALPRPAQSKEAGYFGEEDKGHQGREGVAMWPSCSPRGYAALHGGARDTRSPLSAATHAGASAFTLELQADTKFGTLCADSQTGVKPHNKFLNLLSAPKEMLGTKVCNFVSSKPTAPHLKMAGFKALSKTNERNIDGQIRKGQAASTNNKHRDSVQEYGEGSEGSVKARGLRATRDGGKADNSANGVDTRKNIDDTSKFLFATPSQKEVATLKKYVVDEWGIAKNSGLKIEEFVAYIKGKVKENITKNKVYDWAKRYKMGGIDALIDSRGGKKSILDENSEYKELVETIIKGSQGRVVPYNVYKRFHQELSRRGVIKYSDFLEKRQEVVSYGVIKNFTKRFLAKNRVLERYITSGADGAVSSYLAATGRAAHKALYPNAEVELDATSLDVFAKRMNLDLASEICKMYREMGTPFKASEVAKLVEENQRRYTVVGFIDRYSGVLSYHIDKSENTNAVKRALAKYILKYGKPEKIVSDNGTAFKSYEVQGTLKSLGIEFEAVRAYSGWLKPFIERSWKTFQDNFSENIQGFIGHSVMQRQAIEFGFSKMERRLKKGEKTNLKRMLLINELGELIDKYTDSVMLKTWSDRLGATPMQAYSAKRDFVVLMDRREVYARLGDMQVRRVMKKGVSIGGVYFVNPEMFAHEEVRVCGDLEDSSRVYVWSVDNSFLGVALSSSEKGVSVEVAKAARAFSNKKIEKARAEANRANEEMQANFREFVGQFSANSELEHKSSLGEVIEGEKRKADALVNNIDFAAWELDTTPLESEKSMWLEMVERGNI